jgi:hypothetical protein
VLFSSCHRLVLVSLFEASEYVAAKRVMKINNRLEKRFVEIITLPVMKSSK